jgi:hypothetical protein
MDPSLWGRCLWRTIHIIALGYPKNPTYEDVIAYKNFYENFWKVLPCQSCSINYKRHLKELPLEDFLVSKLKLFEWTVILHNLVNKELNKKEITLDSAIDLYQKTLKYGDDEKTFEYKWVLLFAIATLLVFICWKSR